MVFPFPMKANRVQLNLGGQYRWDNFTFVKKTTGENETYNTIEMKYFNFNVSQGIIKMAAEVSRREFKVKIFFLFSDDLIEWP